MGPRFFEVEGEDKPYMQLPDWWPYTEEDAIRWRQISDAEWVLELIPDEDEDDDA